jgi:hypothetical protein
MPWQQLTPPAVKCKCTAAGLCGYPGELDTVTVTVTVARFDAETEVPILFLKPYAL